MLELWGITTPVDFNSGRNFLPPLAVPNPAYKELEITPKLLAMSDKEFKAPQGPAARDHYPRERALAHHVLRLAQAQAEHP